MLAMIFYDTNMHKTEAQGCANQKHVMSLDGYAGNVRNTVRDTVDRPCAMQH